MHAPRGPLRVGWELFWQSDLPVRERLRRLISNNLRKARRHEPCCGNPGEPGC